MLPIILAAVGGTALGGAVAFLVWRMVVGRRIRAAQIEVEALLTDAQTKHKETILEAKEEALKIKSQAESEVGRRRAEIMRYENRISQKEDNLDKKLDALERREKGIVAKEKEAEDLHAHLQELK
ncbi:MAG: DUF3552 domain-containing protein, partial [Dehalococcoidia bacterium]|nr:DUF3552 domain-containing protein [Dehalococcoidia bacterium]